MANNQNPPAPITDVSLTLDGVKNPFAVLGYSFHLVQSEENGQPFGHPKLVHFSLELASQGVSNLFGWGANKTKKYSGSVDLYSNGTLIDQITFKEAYCTGYKQSGNFSINGGISRITEVVGLAPNSFEWQKEKFARSA